MEQNEQDRKDPGEPGVEPGSGPGQPPRASHGYRNEVSWDGGKGAQPYANQDAELGPAAAHETPGGNRGPASGRNLEQMERLKGKPGREPR